MYNHEEFKKKRKKVHQMTKNHKEQDKIICI